MQETGGAANLERWKSGAPNWDQGCCVILKWAHVRVGPAFCARIDSNQQTLGLEKTFHTVASEPTE